MPETPTNADGGIPLEDTAVVVRLPDARQLETKRQLDGDTVLYEATTDAVASLAVRAPTAQERAPGFEGVQILVVQHGAEAPSSFDFPHELPPGVRLELSPDGGAVLLEGDHVIASIDPPWAYDADGNEVEATYRIVGRTLTMELSSGEVADQAVRYPVVADPNYRIYRSWKDPAGNTIRLRRQYLPKLADHNLWVSSVGDIVTRNRRVHEGGTVYRYWDTVRKWQCSWFTCEVIDSRRVKILYEARRLTWYDNLAKGIFNGYCINPDRSRPCPTWVNQYLN